MQFNWTVYRWTAKCSALPGLISCSLWSFHRLIMCHVTGCSTHDAKLHFLQKQDVGLNSLRVLNTQCTKKQIFLLFNVYDMIRSVLKCRFGPIVLELCRIKMRTIWCGTIHVETAEEYEHSAQAHVTLFFSDKFKFNSNIVTTICNTQVLLLCGHCSSGLHCSFLKPATYAPGFCRLSISVACATEMQVCAAILILACVWLWRFRMYKRLLQFCTAGTCYYTSC